MGNLTTSVKFSFSNLTAVILIGGLGLRLRSVVPDRQKGLALVKGRPFIYYLLDQLRGFGFKHVVLCVGYLGEQVASELGTEYSGLEVEYSREVNPLGTGGALRKCIPLIRSDCVLVMNGDSYSSGDFRRFWNWHNLKRAKVSMLLARVEDTSRYGRVQLDRRSKVKKFEEKGEFSGTGVINAGVYLIDKDKLKSIPSGKVSLEKEIFPSWIGEEFYGYKDEGRFIDIGTPESYFESEQFF